MLLFTLMCALVFVLLSCILSQSPLRMFSAAVNEEARSHDFRFFYLFFFIQKYGRAYPSRSYLCFNRFLIRYNTSMYRKRMCNEKITKITWLYKVISILFQSPLLCSLRCCLSCLLKTHGSCIITIGVSFLPTLLFSRLGIVVTVTLARNNWLFFLIYWWRIDC